MSNYKDIPLSYSKDQQMDQLNINPSINNNQILISTPFNTQAFQKSQNHQETQKRSQFQPQNYQNIKVQYAPKQVTRISYQSKPSQYTQERPKSTSKIYYKKYSTGHDPSLFQSDVMNNQSITFQQFNEMKNTNPKLTLKLKADQYHDFSNSLHTQRNVQSVQNNIAVDRVEYIKRMSKIDIKQEFIQMFERISQAQQSQLNQKVQELPDQQKPLFMKHQLIQEAFVNPQFKEKIYPIQRKIQTQSVRRQKPQEYQSQAYGQNNKVEIQKTYQSQQPYQNEQNKQQVSIQNIVEDQKSNRIIEAKIKTSAQKLTEKINKKALKKLMKSREENKENNVEKKLSFHREERMKSATVDNQIKELDNEVKELKNLEQDFDDDSILYNETDKILQEIYIELNESMKDMQQFPGDETTNTFKHDQIDGEIKNVQRNFTLLKDGKVFEVLENTVLFEYNKITTQIIKEYNTTKQDQGKEIERITETFLDHYDNIKEQRIQEYVQYEQVHEKLKEYYQDLETEEIKVDKIDDEKQTVTLTNVYCKTQVDPQQGKMQTRTTRFTNTQPLTQDQIEQLKQVKNKLQNDEKIVRKNEQELTKEEKDIKIDQLEKKIIVCDVVGSTKNIPKNLSIIYQNLKKEAQQELLNLREENQNQKIRGNSQVDNDLDLKIVNRSQKIINTLDYKSNKNIKRFSLADKIDVLFSKQKGGTKRIKLEDFQLYYEQKIQQKIEIFFLIQIKQNNLIINMSNQEIVEQIWAQYDKDNNKHLDKNEAKKFFDEICAKGSGLEDKRAEIEALVDQNGDGQLHKHEVLAALNMG